MHWPREKSINLAAFTALVWGVFCLTTGLVQFLGVPVADFYSAANAAVQFGIWAFCSLGAVLVISFNRWVFAVLFPILFTVCSVLCYFDLTYGTKLTAVTVEVTLLNATGAMTSTLVSFSLIAVTLLSLAFSVSLTVIRFRNVKEGKRQWLYGLAGIAILIIPTVAVKRIKPMLAARLPFALYYSTKDYLANRRECLAIRDTYDSADVTADAGAPLVVVVIGESLRADHLPMNGYGRNTMPLMSRDSTLVSFPNFHTEFTYTDISVPHLLTRQRPDKQDAAYTEQSFITLFKRAGYKTAWFANQDISASYSYFAHEADSLIYCNAQRSLYSYEKWLDTDILAPFSRWAATGRPHMAVVHTIGSHWWYPSHYTDADMIFKPVIRHKDVGGLDGGEMVNTYDNTIVATDRFLYGLTRMLEGKNAVVFFVSDHGESLGEDGLYLHAADSPPLHNPALMVWWSPEYARLYPAVVEALKANRELPAGNGNIFNTVVDLGRLRTAAWDSTQSLASPRVLNNSSRDLTHGKDGK